MMWLVKLALEKRYTFIVMAIFILLMGFVTISRMSTDIFPEINVPVVAIVWSYSGMSPEDMGKRVILVSERSYTTSVNDIEHIESQAMRGVGIIKVYFHPGAKVEAAIAQITASSQSVLKVLPPGITPPFIIRYNASSVPILQLSLSSKSLSEQQLFDYGQNFIRTQLATVQGASIPLPIGGKSRQIMVDLDPQALQAKGLSANDVVNAINAENLILPSGTAKIGDREYDVALNSSPSTVDQINNFPIRQVNGVTVFVKDVAQVHDGFAVQNNIVREDGIHGALLTVLKSQGASTLDIISRIKATLPRIASTVPPELNIKPLVDQSIFVKASIHDVIFSGIVAACLTATMILIFLGSFRSTFIIIISIPLAILTSVVCLFLCGQTLNVMTLGGLSLAIGILVDDATVEIENIHRNIRAKLPMKEIILNAANQVATPALVSTLSICIVFFPVVMITGAAKSLFIPLAMAVVFAMLASYILSRTLVPILALLLIKPEDEFLDEESSSEIIESKKSKKNLFIRFHGWFNKQFIVLRKMYNFDLVWIMNHKNFIISLFLFFLVFSSMLLPFIGEDFFPVVDAGKIRLHVRAPDGSRIEETEHKFTQVEDAIRQVIPDKERVVILDKIGLPTNGINLATSDNATIGASDGEILIDLKKNHKVSTQEYVKRLRKTLNQQFPEMSFFFQSADIVSQILNFGLAAPIDVQISGRKIKANYALTKKIMNDIKKIPGAVDVHIHQIVDQPQLMFNVDRTRAGQMGLTQKDIASNLLTSLSSSFTSAPNYWINPKNGVNYIIAAQTPQYKMDSVDAIQGTPISSSDNQNQPYTQQMSNLAKVSIARTAAVVNHYNIQSVFDIYVNVQGRDLGSVAQDINKVLEHYDKHLPRGTFIDLRGQVESMFSSFSSLEFGMLIAIILVYLLMVVNFQSWVDPLVIMIPTPAVLSGVLWMLFATRTTFNVPSLMGSIMAIGVATANSILLVSFANEQIEEGLTPKAAAHTAGVTRFRPILMTASAMILGMLPMALGLGEGGEQNAPLGRAVIGGLMVATLATLFLVPTVYSVLNRNKKAFSD